MKKALLLFVLITTFIGAKAQDEKKLPPDLEMLETFYIRYMSVYTDGSQPTDLARKQSQVRRAGCTQRCLDKYLKEMQRTDIDYDPFLKLPDVDQDALRTLEVAKVPNKPGLYTVSYMAGTEKFTINLTLVKQGDEWKIDDMN